MNLQPERIFRVINVKDELPDMKHKKDFFVFKTTETGNYLDTKISFDLRNPEITHWLKEESAYVFTKEELLNLIYDSWWDGYYTTEEQLKAQNKLDKFLESHSLTNK